MPRHLDLDSLSEYWTQPSPQDLYEQHRAQSLAARLDAFEAHLEARQLLPHVATALIEHYLQPLAQRLANDCGLPGTIRLYLSGQHTVRVEYILQAIPLTVGRLSLRDLVDSPEDTLGDLLRTWTGGYSPVEQPEPRSFWDHIMDED